MENKTEQNFGLKEFAIVAQENHISWVCFRAPNAKNTTTFVQLYSCPEKYASIKELRSKHGFVLAPFEISQEQPIRLIAPDLIINGSNFYESLSQETINGIRPFKDRCIDQKKHEKPHVETQEAYCQSVKDIIKEINSARLDKVVLSRISLEDKPMNFDLDRFFHTLEIQYPEAFVYLLYIPDQGYWCGASPEPLLQMDETTTSTVSLAGTRKAGKERAWGDKEIHEQDLVSRYIEKALEKHNIEQYSKEGPFTVKAGMVEHLKSIFTFSSRKLSDGFVNFLQEIHPTPSVCGLPKKTSLSAIKKTENHKREYYCGFLGVINMNEYCNLFVNLRCMQITDQDLVYYLGAGITADSDPKKEWEETNAKKTTLENILKQFSQS